MSALLFQFPRTAEGRHLLRRMIAAVRSDSVPPGFRLEEVDFDDFAAYVEYQLPECASGGEK